MSLRRSERWASVSPFDKPGEGHTDACLRADYRYGSMPLICSRTIKVERVVPNALSDVR